MGHSEVIKRFAEAYVGPFAGSGEPDKLALRFVSITRNPPIEDVLSPVIKRIANKVDYERTSKTDDRHLLAPAVIGTEMTVLSIRKTF